MGSGDIAALGRVDSLSAKIMGSGDINCGELNATAAELVIMGSGDIVAHCIHEVDASIMGSGSIRIFGNPPARSRDVSGSGKIRFA